VIEGKKKIFPVHYAPGKKLFHIVVTLSDAPGSYSSILDLVRTKVNLIGTSTYTRSDGTAIFSGFSEALSPSLTAKELKRLISGSKAAIATTVYEGDDGLLVDTFHTGFVVGDEEYILMRRDGLVRVFDRVSKMLGSGGDALLFEEGMAMGLRNAEMMIESVGAKRVRAQMKVLNRFLAAQGWGQIEARAGPGKEGFTVRVVDCFECSADGSSRRGCNFMRGYLAGGAKATFGREYESKETKCRLKGAEACEFVLTPR
jgi:predicted hydrocarbon binding protein